MVGTQSVCSVADTNCTFKRGGEDSVASKLSGVIASLAYVDAPVPPDNSDEGSSSHPAPSQVSFCYRYPTIHNVICGGDLQVATLDLPAIACRLRSSEYNPQRFTALTLRIRTPRSTVMIFPNGRLVATGAPSIDSSRHALAKAACAIHCALVENCRDSGHPAPSISTVSDFRVYSLVASVDLGLPILLDALLYAASKGGKFKAVVSGRSAAAARTPANKSHVAGRAYYEPDAFPGVVLRASSEHLAHISALTFVSGKVVFTGAHGVDELRAAADDMLSFILAQATKGHIPQLEEALDSEEEDIADEFGQSAGGNAGDVGVPAQSGGMASLAALLGDDAEEEDFDMDVDG